MKYKKALDGLIIDSQWYAFIMLFFVCSTFSTISALGHPVAFIWGIAFSTVMHLFQSAMTYAETEN